MLPLRHVLCYRYNRAATNALREGPLGPAAHISLRTSDLDFMTALEAS